MKESKGKPKKVQAPKPNASAPSLKMETLLPQKKK
jgi:hypothetical protein